MKWLRTILEWGTKAARQRRPTMNTEAEVKARLLRQMHTLASMDAGHPVWVTILEIVDDHEGNMVERVLEESLSSEERHYRAGLAADARYLGNALRDLKAKADAEFRQKQSQ